MFPLNLQLLCNNPDADSFYKYEKVFSKRDIDMQVRNYEMDCLKIFVTELNLPIVCWDAFYYNYQIPQIGKEFDLLRFCNEFILNIELKSDIVPLEDIKKQLIRNRYYLRHIRNEILLFSLIVKGGKIQKIYSLDGEDLAETNITCIKDCITKSVSNCYVRDLDKLFKPSMFLVSPINNPERFIERNYFLTPQQEEIKRSVSAMIDSGTYSHLIVNGKAGSGKTLLLYDLAKKIADSGKIAVVIHVGIKDAGHYELEKLIPNFKIIAIKYWEEIMGMNFETVFIDESQRLYVSQLKGINKICKERKKVCLFCLDPEQLLNRDEVQRGVAKFLSTQRGSFILNKKIRTNKELATFIKALFNLPRVSTDIQYKNIRIEFTNTEFETKNVLQYYKENNFVYISHTPSSRVVHNTLDTFKSSKTSHKVIGQEFDKVVVILDQDFYYTNKGELTGIKHPCPDYMYRGLLFQEVTRAREELSIIVYKNSELYKKIISILNGEIFIPPSEAMETNSLPRIEQLSFEDIFL